MCGYTQVVLEGVPHAINVIAAYVFKISMNHCQLTDEFIIFYNVVKIFHFSINISIELRMRFYMQKNLQSFILVILLV